MQNVTLTSARMICWFVTDTNPISNTTIGTFSSAFQHPVGVFPARCIMILPALALIVGAGHKLCAAESSNTHIAPRDAGLIKREHMAEFKIHSVAGNT